MHENNKRYHRGVSIIEWRSTCAAPAGSVPRFPERDAVLRLFQQDICPSKYPRMAWEVCMLRTQEISEGLEPREELPCWKVPELVEGHGEGILCVLEQLRREESEQRELRLTGGPGKRKWPSAAAVATFARKGCFFPFASSPFLRLSESCIAQETFMCTFATSFPLHSPATCPAC